MNLFNDLIHAYPFYKKSRELWMLTQETQIMKGLQKYPEPFTPSHWTADELLTHALEESVDLTHYLVGLKELLDEKDARIQKLTEMVERLQEELEEERYGVVLSLNHDDHDY